MTKETEKQLDNLWSTVVEQKKRIAELEAENEQIKNSDTLCKLIGQQKRKITELEQENKVLAQNLEDTEILNKTYEKRFSDLEKKNSELDCQKNRNKFCYSCANATEKCFKNEIGCPCGKYKSYKDENAELRNNGFSVSAMTEQQLKVALEKGEQLEKENAELKADNDARKFAMAMSEKVEKQLQKEKCELIETIQARDKAIQDLKKENAELQEEISADKLSTVVLLEQTQEQLTNAREIIKKFLLWENDWHNKTESKYELLKQAEQFLNSEVEKC